MTTTITPKKATLPTIDIQPGKLFINGQWRDSKDGKTRPTINPTTEEPITDIAQATQEDVNEAVEAAHNAFTGTWSRMGAPDRARLLIRVAELVEKYADELAYREAIDMGKPIYFAKLIDCRLMADLFYYYSGMATHLEGATRLATPPAPNASAPLNYTRREPLGVVAAITPFNFPMLLSGSKFAPALAAGNTIIHKPASATPLTAIKMAEIFAEAGLPDGVFNLVTGPGGMVGNALVRHPGVKKIGFTGSTAVGKQLAKDAVDTLKKVTLELGGKSANIIFEDADLDNAAYQAFFGIFYNKGEICTAGSRLLVQRSVYDEVVAKVADLIETMPIGNPIDPDTRFGPQVDRDQLNKCIEYTRYGLEDGATLYTGGNPIHPDSTNGKGYFFEPTIFTSASNDMRIARDEIFGPVLTVIPFETEAEAIQIANNSEYGLAAGVHTMNLKRAHRVAHQLEAGICWVNTYNQFDISTPFGGYKASGIGRELGPEVMENYTQVKSVWVDLS